MAGRIRRREGDVLKIALGNERHSYAQASFEPLIVFFDGAFTNELPVEEIAQLPVLFRIWVHNDAVCRGTWPVIGSAPLSADNAAEPFFYKQDAISGRLFMYHSTFAGTGWECEATFSECAKLECAAVWDAEHVVERLEDHYAGRPNRWLESLRIQA